MESKLTFLAITALAVVAIPPIIGGMTAAIGHLAGMRRPAVLALASSAVAATAASVIGLAGVVAGVLFS